MIPFKPDHLKILIVGTPRTGNTWTKLLLSKIYDLPLIDLPAVFEPDFLEAQGDRWICHKHYAPTPRLLAWAKEHRLVLITTVRHPGDILVSLFHFVNYQAPLSPVFKAPKIMALDGGVMGENTLHYVKTGFSYYLDISLYWMLSHESLVVRYEDLWQDPFGSLATLTAQIHPVPQDRIQQALVQCDFDFLHEYHDPRFFRSGRIGEWRASLTPEVLEVLKQVPYSVQFEILGYGLQAIDPANDPFALPRTDTNPFRKRATFDNGIPIPPIVMQIYIDDGSRIERWPWPYETENRDSFLGWLNAPAEADPLEGAAPVITNLAGYVYKTRPDLQKAYPNPFGQDRAAFAAWFLTYAAAEYALPAEMLDPIRHSSIALGE